jgi:hypothetical protein
MRVRWLQTSLAVLLAALAVLLVVMVLGGDDDVSLTPGEPQIVTVGELESFAEDADHDVYWIGERPDTEYELMESPEGRIFVRYLPLRDGPSSNGLLTVATYPIDDGAAALERTARQDDSKEIASSDDGAVVLIDRESEENAHLAYPGEDVQVEIFSPVPGEALRIAARDKVEPIS